MTVRFIVNPIAGRGRTRTQWPDLRRSIPASVEYDVVETTAPGAATVLARQAAAEGVERVIAVGGDGTVSEAAAGLRGTRTALGMIPSGSACDLRRSVGLPKRLPEALAYALTGGPKPMDVGLANGTTFVNVAGIGLDAEVAAEVNRRRDDSSTGTWLYVKCLLRVLGQYRPSHVALTVDGQRIEATALMVAIGNAQYYGGGMRIVPTAQINDGYLDVMLVGEFSVAGTLWLLPKVFSGSHRYHPRVTVYRCREVLVETEATLNVHVDGETAGVAPLRATVDPGSLQMIAPIPRLSVVGAEPVVRA